MMHNSVSPLLAIDLPVQEAECEYAAETMRSISWAQQENLSFHQHAFETLLLLTAEGIFLYVSENVVDLLGREAEELIGNSIIEPVYEEDRMAVLEIWSRLLDNPGGKARTRTRVYHKDGSLRWAEVFAVNLLHLTGVNAVVAYAHDVTEAAETRRALHESEAVYCTLTEISDDIVSLHDLSGRMIYVSPASERITGYSDTEVLGTSVADLAYEGDRERVEAAFQQVLAGKSILIEWRRQRKDSELIWLESRASLVQDAQGSPLQIVFVSRDITERRLMERALRRSQKRMLNILESTSDGYMTLDNEASITYVNSQAVRFLGLSIKEVLNHSLWDLYPRYRTMELGRGVETALRKQQPVRLEHQCDVSGRWYHVSLFPSQDGLSVYLSDISERKQAEEETRRNIERLRESVQGVVRAMSTTVELRDPYTAGHQRRVARLAASIASRMGYPPEGVELMLIAGQLHDVGKIAVPAEILTRPGRLSASEMAIIQSHARVGYEILKDIPFDPIVALTALQHHERLDGSGYPDGISGEAILPASRIMGVADVVEAMASHRPFRAALGVHAALAEVMRYSGTRFDPDVVKACLDVFEEHEFDIESVTLEKQIVVSEATVD